MIEEIELGTIAIEYAALSSAKKKAVSYLIRSEKYVSGSSGKDGGVYLGWEANPFDSIRMISVMAQIGTKEYGKQWLEELKSRISQLA